MPPGFVPPRTALPKGPKTRIVKPKAPAPPRVVKPKIIDPNQAATQNAMSAFHTALAQLKASTPAVDSNAIYAPYRASQQVTGQLGQGLQQAVTNAGQAAQSQYGAGLAEAQKTAAQFGVSAGAGAGPTALTNNGSSLIAQQTQAQAAAAPMAATAWQQLLERSAGAKVADANLQRQNSLTAGQQGLAANIPAAIGNEKQLAFQQDTAKKNFALAVGSATDKRTNDLRDYLLGVGKLKLDEGHTKSAEEIAAEKLKLEKGRLRVSQDALALKRRTSTAAASGLKGVAAAAKALSGSQTKPGEKRVAKGWDVQVVSYDPEANTTGTEIKTVHVPDKRYAPAGFKIVPNSSASTHWETVPTAGGSAGITRAQWDAQMRSLLAQNKTYPNAAAAIKAFLGPRPKK